MMHLWLYISLCRLGDTKWGQVKERLVTPQQGEVKLCGMNESGQGDTVVVIANSVSSFQRVSSKLVPYTIRYRYRYGFRHTTSL